MILKNGVSFKKGDQVKFDEKKVKKKYRKYIKKDIFTIIDYTFNFYGDLLVLLSDGSVHRNPDNFIKINKETNLI